MDRSWFESLFGFVETSAEDVRQNLVLEGTRLRSRANQRVFEAGTRKSPDSQGKKKWRRGESNPRPRAVHDGLYTLSPRI